MRVVTAAIAIAAGIFVLLGYFLPEQLGVLRLTLVDWAIIIAAIAVLVGIFNMIAVQMEKVSTRQKGGFYSVLLVASLFLTFAAAALLGTGDPYVRLTVNAVIVPAEASLMAILAITLVYASIRLLRRRVDAMSIIFLVAAVFFLAISMPTPFATVTALQDSILQGASWLSGGGARGLLLGIALGTLLTGLRVLFGVDRPYGGN